MNNKNIFKLVLPVVLSASLVMVSTSSMAGDLQLKPLKSPLSKTSTDTKKSSTSPLAQPTKGTATRTPSAPSIGGVNTNKLTPTNTRTTQSINKQQTSSITIQRNVYQKYERITSNNTWKPYEDSKGMLEGANRNFYEMRESRDKFKRQLDRCVNGSYNSQEQRDAGCTSSTTMAQCQENLLMRCMHNASRELAHDVRYFDDIVKQLAKTQSSAGLILRDLKK